MPQITAEVGQAISRLYELNTKIAAIRKEMAEQLDPLQEDCEKVEAFIASQLFPNPQEGENSVPLGAGWSLDYVVGMRREVDESGFTAVKRELKKKGLAFEDYFTDKTSLNLPKYKKATKAVKEILDLALSTMPGKGNMVFVPPPAEEQEDKPAAKPKRGRKPKAK